MPTALPLSLVLGSSEQDSIRSMDIRMRLVKMKSVWRLLWTDMVKKSAGTGIPLMDQVMDPLCKEFPRLLLLLQPMHQCSHDIFI
jgi:hypothetical protein